MISANHYTSTKKIQKYLAGEREGFSLVELIIVIAIMAILIGVIALAVIPNIQRSRESKDLSTLDNVLSACNVAAANAQMKVKEKAEVVYDKDSGALTITGSDAFKAQYVNAIGDGAQTLSSSVGSGKDIKATVEITESNVAKITVWADGADACKYTTNDDGSAKKLEVKSGE